MKLMMKALAQKGMLQCALFFICCNQMMSIESLLGAHGVVSDEDDELVVELFSC